MKKAKRLLPLLIVVSMLLSLAGFALADNQVILAATDMEGQIVILHTNDSHSRVDTNLGFASVAGAKAYYESLGAEVLLLDDGDTLHGFPIANLSYGSNIVDIMNAVGYDAMTPGNHDFNYGTARLLELEDEMDFALLAANFTTNSGAGVFAGNVVFDLGGVKVGVFGLATPETATKTNPLNVEGYSFNADKLAEIAQEQINSLKSQGAEYIIALGHLGVDTESAPWRSIDVISKISGLDIFIDGHSHTELANLPEALDKNGDEVVLTSTGEYIKNIGMITIKDGEITASYVPEDVAAKKDAEITEMITAINDELRPLLNEIVGNTSVFLNGARSPGVRTQETNLGDLAADALRYVSGADIGFTNGGGIRTSLPVDHTVADDKNYIEGAKKGDITYGDLNSVFPFGNVVVTIEITGADILAALEHGTKSTPNEAGGFPQVSGISYDIHTYASEYRVQNVKVNGEPLVLNKKYTLATNDFTHADGDGYTMFGKYPKTGEYGAMDEALIVYIAEALDGTVGEEYAEPQGRINIVRMNDVTAEDWFSKNIPYVLSAGLMTGTGNDTFSPNGEITRAMFITILYRIAGSPAVTNKPSAYFTDTIDGTWYSNAIVWARESGILTGTDVALAAQKGSFHPEQLMTREQIASLIYSLAEYLEILPEDEAEMPDFDDAAIISYWAADGVTYCASLGVITGLPDNTFDPQGTATRAQVAAVVERFVRLG